MNVDESINEVITIFDSMLEKYKPFNNTGKRKYYHSKEVAEISMKLCKDLTTEKRLIMYIIALFHDIGRFEENVTFNGIKDNNKFDHALQTILIMNESNEIQSYLLKKNLYNKRKDMYASIYYHNKLIDNIKCNCDYLKILRDADKISILRLVEKENLMSLNLKQPFSKNNLDDFYNRKCINNMNIVTDSDKLLKYISFIYDINFKETTTEIETLVRKILDKVFSYSNNPLLDDLEKIYHYVELYFKTAKEED